MNGPMAFTYIMGLNSFCIDVPHCSRFGVIVLISLTGSLKQLLGHRCLAAVINHGFRVARYGNLNQILDCSRARVFQLRNPTLDILTIWVKLFLLQPGIKDSEIGLGITASRSRPLPVTIVSRRVIIKELTGKISLAPAPIKMKILDQEGSGNHPGTVMHNACAVQLTHPGIHHWESGFAFRPGSEPSLVLVPFNILKLRLKR